MAVNTVLVEGRVDMLPLECRMDTFFTCVNYAIVVKSLV